MKVFVYGTLMHGDYNHSLIREGNCKFIREAVTKRGFTLYDLGGFPGMIKGGNSEVVGEVYEVCSTTVNRMDILEGHPQFYRRSIIELQSGEQVQTYILDDSYVRGCPVIKSGSWKNK